MYVEKVSNIPACCRRDGNPVIYPVKFQLRGITIEAAEKEAAEHGYIIQPAPFPTSRPAELRRERVALCRSDEDRREILPRTEERGPVRLTCCPARAANYRPTSRMNVRH